MVQTDTCRKCASKDTLEHRLLVCGEGKLIWEYSKPLIARMLRTIPHRIPDDWIIHPQFHIRPPKRRRAMLWTLANVIIFRPQQQTNVTLQDYVDFLQRSKWKLMRQKMERIVGNYLTVLEAGGKNLLQ